MSFVTVVVAEDVAGLGSGGTLRTLVSSVISMNLGGVTGASLELSLVTGSVAGLEAGSVTCSGGAVSSVSAILFPFERIINELKCDLMVKVA